MKERARPVVRVAASTTRQRAWSSAIDEWAAGKSWAARIPVLLCFAYLFYRHAQNPFYGSLLGGFDLIIHELGHFLWAPFGEFAAVLGGSLTQCLAPVVAGAIFYRQRDYFAIAVACCWLGVNLFEVSTYAADGLTQQLTLISPVGDDPIHDWGYILGRWEKLSKARQIGGAIRAAGMVSLTSGLVGGLYVVTRMRIRPAPESAER